ncbi:hypothetical protein D9613_011505 [Agrocybe pediades]|uniref:Uncharacterized protein n=1 Tax=Agrocybe pediades TaxID=84607 RepID=A0A8H4QVH1_9AGAR|nr:hypothetical protein D9613_013006 [Agrocybe pediades]KAF4618152.1 hypothetical protein D9613_011505 [Agrocybe pediades]
MVDRLLAPSKPRGQLWYSNNTHGRPQRVRNRFRTLGGWVAMVLRRYLCFWREYRAFLNVSNAYFVRRIRPELAKLPPNLADTSSVRTTHMDE